MVALKVKNVCTYIICSLSGTQENLNACQFLFLIKSI